MDQGTGKKLMFDQELMELWGRELHPEQLERIEQGLIELNNIRVPVIARAALKQSESTGSVRYRLPAWIVSGAVMAACLVLFVLWRNPFTTHTSTPVVVLTDREVEKLAALFEEDFNDSFLDSFIRDESFVMEKLL